MPLILCACFETALSNRLTTRLAVAYNNLQPEKTSAGYGWYIMRDHGGF